MSNLTDDERERLTATYREAIHADDFDTQARLRMIAETDADLTARLQGVHAAILADVEASGIIPATVPPTA